MTKYLNCYSAKVHKRYIRFQEKFWGTETFDSFLFSFNYVAFLSFESMFTENVNRHVLFHILSRKIECIQVNVRVIVPVLFTKQTAKAKSGSHYPTKPHGCRFMGFQFNLTFKIIPFGSHASRFWLMSHNLRFKLYLQHSFIKFEPYWIHIVLPLLLDSVIFSIILIGSSKIKLSSCILNLCLGTQRIQSGQTSITLNNFGSIRQQEFMFEILNKTSFADGSLHMFVCFF